MNQWWKAHSGAILAFVGAGGALIGNFDPALAALTEGFAENALIAVGIAGAVLQAYIGTKK